MKDRNEGGRPADAERPRISAGTLTRTSALLLSEAHAYADLIGAMAHGHTNPKLVTTADGAPRVAHSAIVAKSTDGKDARPYNI